MVTSVEKLTKMARASTKQVRGCLGYLQTANIAAIKTASQYTIVTIVNWNSYQNPDEYNGKPNGEAKGEQRANQGQSEGKPGATIKEGNQGIIQAGKTTPLDDSDASHENRSKPPEFADGVRSENGEKPKNAHTSEEQKTFSENGTGEKKKPVHSSDDRKTLRAAMARHLGHIIGPMELLATPDDGEVNAVLATLGTHPVEGFRNYLENLPAQYQLGGRNAPRKWAWFITVAQNYIGTQTPSTPTADRCRHGSSYGICCNRPEVDEAYSDSFSTTDDLRRIQ